MSNSKRPRSPERSSAMWKIFELIGRYFMLMGKVFSRPEKAAIYRAAHHLRNGVPGNRLDRPDGHYFGIHRCGHHPADVHQPRFAVHPRSLVGYATRETMILEFSSTVVALILAGKGRFEHRFGDRHDAHYRTDRRAGDHGCQFGFVPHPAEDRRRGGLLPFLTISASPSESSAAGPSPI